MEFERSVLGAVVEEHKNASDRRPNVAQERGNDVLIKTSVSALSRLPIEILQIVFQQCVWQDVDGHVMTGLAMPWALSQVCAMWRAVATSTGLLWSVIKLNMDSALKVQAPVELADTYFQRSDPLPVSCLLELGNNLHATRALRGKFIHKVLSFSSRIRDLSIDFDDDIEAANQWASSSVEFPVLRTLHLLLSRPFDMEDSDDEDDGDVLGSTDPVVVGISDAPSLIEVDITTPDFYPLLALPWANLKNLDCSFHSFDKFCQVARQLTSVESWTVDFFWLLGGYPHAPPVEFPHLRLLSIRGDPGSLLAVLDLLIAPALEELQLKHKYREIGSVREAESVLLAVCRLQERSSSRIRRLSACLPLLLSPIANEAASASLVSLEELCLSIPTFDTYRKHYFDSLESLEKPSFLPNLKTLHLDFQKRSESLSRLFERLIEVAETRLTSSLKLERLSFCANDAGVHITSERLILLKNLELKGVALLGNVCENEWKSTFDKELAERTQKYRRKNRYNLRL